MKSLLVMMAIFSAGFALSKWLIPLDYHFLTGYIIGLISMLSAHIIENRI